MDTKGRGRAKNGPTALGCPGFLEPGIRSLILLNFLMRSPSWGRKTVPISGPLFGRPCPDFPLAPATLEAAQRILAMSTVHMASRKSPQPIPPYVPAIVTPLLTTSLIRCDRCMDVASFVGSGRRQTTTPLPTPIASIYDEDGKHVLGKPFFYAEGVRLATGGKPHIRRKHPNCEALSHTKL